MQKIGGFIFLLLVVSNCSVTENKHLEQLEESLMKWQEIRQEIQGNYSYKVTQSSMTGVTNETEIIVNYNKVVERQFRLFSVPSETTNSSTRIVNVDWTEVGRGLGQSTEGAPIKTLDELYQQAKTLLQRKLKKYEKRYVSFDKQGLLQSSYIIDLRIADDAPIDGVNISELLLQSKKSINRICNPSNVKAFPIHWGDPPRIQTKDYRVLPAGYGCGSSTLLKWIEKNQAKDQNSSN
jgi:hypothetical protein